MAKAVKALTGVAEAAVGIAAIYTGVGAPAGLTLLTAVEGGAAIIGGVATAVGAATGNQALSNIGGVVGLAGAATAAFAPGGLVDALTNPAVATATTTQQAIDAAAPAAPAATVATPADQAALAPATAANSGQAAAAAPGSEDLSAQAGAQQLSSTQPPAGVQPPELGTTTPAPPTPAPTMASANPAADQVVAGQIPTAAAQNPATPQLTVAPGGTQAAINQNYDAFGNPVGGSLPAQTPMPPQPDQSQGLLSKFANWAGNNPVPAMVGTNALLQGVGGIASYIAPSPLQRSQIALQTAETQRQQQVMSMTAAKNATINAWAQKQGTPPPAPLAASNPSQPNAALPPINNAPGNVYSINNSPTANPGLLGTAGAPIPGVS